MSPDINTITFLDIETVPAQEWLQLEPKKAEFFIQKFKRQICELHPNLEDLIPTKSNALNPEQKSYPIMWEYQAFQDFYNMKASIHAEFNKIICVALGGLVIKSKDQPATLFIRAFSGLEQAILEGVSQSLAKRAPTHICAHNGLGFDFPVLGRKYLMAGLPIPAILDARGKKPWDIPWIDTQNLWAFGEYKYYIAQEHLADLLGVHGSKSEMEGKDVLQAFKDGKIQDICRYCAGDVATLANNYFRMNNLPLFPKEAIEFKL